MIIKTINFRFISNSEQVVIINKCKIKLVSYDIASAIFELTKMRALKLINNAIYNKSVIDILKLN